MTTTIRFRVADPQTPISNEGTVDSVTGVGTRLIAILNL